MTEIQNNVDELDDIVNKYNNTYHRIVKMKPVDVKSSIYIDHSVQCGDENHKFKVGVRVRILKYKYIFGKGYTPNWSKVAFVIKS